MDLCACAHECALHVGKVNEGGGKLFHRRVDFGANRFALFREFGICC
jgi:hypothetical protein